MRVSGGAELIGLPHEDPEAHGKCESGNCLAVTKGEKGECEKMNRDDFVEHPENPYARTRAGTLARSL